MNACQFDRALIDRDELKKEPWASFVARAKSLGSGIGPSGYEPFPQYTGPVHKAGLIAYHYTLNTKWQMLLLRQFGSDGLFTDAADRGLKLFRGSSIALEQAFQKAGY